MQRTHFVRVNYCCESNKNRERILHWGYFIDLASVNWHQQGAMTCNETLSTSSRGKGHGTTLIVKRGGAEEAPERVSEWGAWCIGQLAIKVVCSSDPSFIRRAQTRGVRTPNYTYKHIYKHKITTRTSSGTQKAEPAKKIFFGFSCAVANYIRSAS